MSDIIERIIIDDSKAIASLGNISKNVGQLDKSFNDLRNQTKKTTEDFAGNLDKTGKKSKEFTDKAAQNNRSLSSSYSNLLRSFGPFGEKIEEGIVKLGEYKSKLIDFVKSHTDVINVSDSSKTKIEGFGKSIGIGSKALGTFTKGLGIMKVALISTGIGALIVGLGSLITFLSRSQKGMDFIEQKTAYVGAAFRKLSDFVAGVGEKIFDAFDKPKEAVSNLWTAIKDNLMHRLEALPLFFSAIGRAIKALFSADWDSLKQAGVDAGSAIAQSITGLDKTQQKEFLQGVGNLVTEMDKAGSAAENLKKQFRELEREKTLYSKTESELISKSERQREISKNTALSLKERLIAARKALEYDDMVDAKKLSFARRNLALIRQENALRKSNDKDLEREAQAYVEYMNLKIQDSQSNIKFNKVINQTTEAAIDRYKEAAQTIYDLSEQFNLLSESQKRSSDRDQQISDLNKLKDGIQELIDLQIELSKDPKTKDLKLIDIEEAKKQVESVKGIIKTIISTESIDKLIDDVNKKEQESLLEIEKSSVLSEQEKQDRKKEILLRGEKDRLLLSSQYLNRDSDNYRKAILRIEEINNELNDPAKLQKILIDESLKRQSNEELIAYNTIKNKEELEKELTKIKAQGEIDRLEIENKFLSKTSSKYLENLVKIKEIQSKTDIIPSNWWEDVKTFDDLWNKFLNETFGEDTGNKIKDFVSGLKSFISEWGSLLEQSSEIQLANLDKLIKSTTERKEKAQSDLEKEREFFEKGLANNYESTKANVNNLISEEERLTSEREKIQKKAEKRQLIADTVQQTTSLITASINIIKGFSNIPVVGLPLGIAAVSTLLGFFIKTKADAFKATKLYTGANKISDYFGFGQYGGESDLSSKPGKGYRLVSESTGAPTDVIISGNEMLIPEKVSMKNYSFFDNLKRGKYDDIDIEYAIDFHKRFKHFERNKIASNNVNIIESKTRDQRDHFFLLPLENNKFVVYKLDTLTQNHGSIISIEP